MSEKKNTSDREPVKRYKVFVSSTYLDNIEQRRSIQETIILADMGWCSLGPVPDLHRKSAFLNLCS